jgi:hypothetical protein
VREYEGIPEGPATQQGFAGRDSSGGPVQLIVIRPVHGIAYISLARVGAYGTCSTDPAGRPTKLALVEQGHATWRVHRNGRVGGTVHDYKVPLDSGRPENQAGMTLNARVGARTISGTVGFTITESRSAAGRPEACTAGTQAFMARLGASRRVFVPAGG